MYRKLFRCVETIATGWLTGTGITGIVISLFDPRTTGLMIILWLASLTVFMVALGTLGALATWKGE